jgi:hypothetical protein
LGFENQELWISRYGFWRGEDRGKEITGNQKLNSDIHHIIVYYILQYCSEMLGIVHMVKCIVLLHYESQTMLV